MLSVVSAPGREGHIEDHQVLAALFLSLILTLCPLQKVEELKDLILQLRFPYRVLSKDSTPRVKRKIFGISSPSKSPPPQVPPPAFSDRSCLVLLHKPLEKLLIK